MIMQRWRMSAFYFSLSGKGEKVSGREKNRNRKTKTHSPRSHAFIFVSFDWKTSIAAIYIYIFLKQQRAMEVILATAPLRLSLICQAV